MRPDTVELRTSLAAVLHQRMRHLAAERLAGLLRRFARVSDAGLRSRAFLSELGGTPPSVAVEFLRLLEELAARRVPVAQKLYLDLLDRDLVRTALPPAFLDDVWRLGRVHGYHRTLEAFFCAGSHDARLDGPLSLPPDIRDIPLGRRKAMARSGQIAVLERLLADTHPAVVGNLLANPRLTEREVVKLAARRPASPAILAAVAAHRTWIARYQVKKALAFNPDTPVSISVPLLKYLLRPDLVELTRRSSAVELVKRAARKLLGE